MADTEEQQSLQASVWVGVGQGGMIRRRDSLDPTHPESWFSLWFKKYASLDDFPWEMIDGCEDGPPRSFPWKAFGLNPFKKCPSCGHVHEEEKDFPDEAYGQ